MALYVDLPVYKATYDLLLVIFKLSSNFSKEYKYTVGESLKKDMLELIKLIYRANTESNKKVTLQYACENIEIIKVQLRLMQDMNQIGLKSFVNTNKQVDLVSKQLRGWLKSQT